MLNRGDYLRLLAYAGFIGVTLGICRGFGVRDKEETPTEYLGQPAALVHEDVRWGPDRYFILINKGADEETRINLNAKNHENLLDLVNSNKQNK